MATATKRRKKTSKTGSVSKAQAIRDAAQQLGGKKVRPKDVIAALAAEGVTVAPAQVSATLKAAGFRRIRRKGAPLPKTTHGSATNGLSLEHLLAAKALIAKIGSVEIAKKALDAMAKLG